MCIGRRIDEVVRRQFETLGSDIPAYQPQSTLASRLGQLTISNICFSSHVFKHIGMNSALPVFVSMASVIPADGGSSLRLHAQ